MNHFFPFFYLLGDQVEKHVKDADHQTENSKNQEGFICLFFWKRSLNRKNKSHRNQLEHIDEYPDNSQGVRQVKTFLLFKPLKHSIRLIVLFLDTNRIMQGFHSLHLGSKIQHQIPDFVFGQKSF